MAENMNIMVSVNSNYVKYLMVLLTSLFRNNQESAITVYVLNSDLTKEDKTGLEQTARSYGQSLIPITVDQGVFEAYPVTALWSVETYFRLLAVEVLPESLERILYLDIDLVVDGSLSELYETEFEDKYFIVCEDNHGYIDVNRKNEKWGRDFGIPYFNAGVLLYNMKKIRKDYPYQVFQRYAEELHYDLEQVDQDLLNYIFGEKVKYVDYRKYNKMIRRAEKGVEFYKNYGTVLYHYAGNEKPWGAKYLTPFFRIWWDYARLTPNYKVLRDEFTDNCNKEVEKETKVKAAYEQYYKLCIRWIRLDAGRERLKRFLENSGCHTAAIYGAGVMGKALYDYLKGSGVRVKYMIDRNRSLSYSEAFDTDFYFMDGPLPEVDLIIITPVQHAESIKTELEGKGKRAAFSLDEILDWIENSSWKD